MVDHARLLHLLSYNEQTGQFTHRQQSSNRIKAGDVSGYVDSLGYWALKIDRGRYKGHRVAWFYVHGKWPPQEIDHIDGNKLNNAIANLRLANRAENVRNRGTPRANTSGYKGVSFHKHQQKWRAYITANGRQHSLGYFDNREDAARAYAAAVPEVHGEFGRPS